MTKVLRVDVDLAPEERITSEEAEIVEERMRQVFTELKLNVSIESYVTGNSVSVDCADAEHTYGWNCPACHGNDCVLGTPL